MNILNVITILILAYILITFIIPVLILPNYLFFKSTYKITSKKLKKEIKELNKIKNDKKFVKAAFDFVTRKYKSADPITFLLNLPKLFWHNPNKIIERSGFAYCHVQNIMLKTILQESGRFRESQIKVKINFTVVIHQYLILKTKNFETELDPYGFSRGVPYGKHLNARSFLLGN